MKRLTEQLIHFAAGHRITVLAVLVLLGLFAGLSLLRIKFTNDVSGMFPDSQDAGTTFRILNETRLGNTVQLEFISVGPVELHEKYLDSAVEKLKNLPGVKNPVFRYRAGDPLDEISAFTGLLVRFYGPEILVECNAEIAAENTLKQLAFPTPGSMKLLRNQPFGLERKILRNLNLLDEMTGMKISPEKPYFTTRDQHRAMMVFDTDIQLGDAASVRKLLDRVRQSLEPLPSGMQWRIISGIMHTLGNEEVLKRDATISGTVSLLLFLLLFLICYRRDWRALWIPAIPLYASLLALGVMTVFFREICLYVIGLGSCITGLAVDQGIHVYAAFRGRDAERRTAALTEPMALSAATSILVFIFLAFTGIRAYIQLAAFAGLSLLFSCVIALVVLPLLLNRDHRILELKIIQPEWKIPPGGLLILLPILFVCGKILLKNADFSLESLDGTPDKIREEEQDFNRAWRSSGLKTAVIAAVGKNSDDALCRLRQVVGPLSSGGISAVMPPVPPRSEQILNRTQWRTPETMNRITRLEEQTRSACKKFRLPEKFFQPFFENLRKAISSDDLTLPPMLESVMKKMVKTHGEKATAVALLPDTINNARAVRLILKKRNDEHYALLSKEGFKQMVREDLGGRFLWILPLSILFALLLAYLFFRKISDVLLAVTPVLVSFCGLFILGALTGFKATPAAAFALVLLTGLAIDYGIYAVSQLRHPEEISVRSSVLLSAATTVAGAGALIFSNHPALFGTGCVLAVGITLACLSGLYLVPMLKRKWKKEQLLLVVLFVIPLNGCKSGIPFEEYPEAQILKRKMKIYPETPFQLQANAVLEMLNRKYTFLLAAELNSGTGEIKAAGISGAGTLLFRINGLDCTAGSGMPENAGKLLSAFQKDLCRIFLLKNQTPLAVKRKTEYIALSLDNGVKWEFYPDKIICQSGSFPVRKWMAEYRDSGRTVWYCNYRRNYTVRLKIIRLAEKGKR